MSEASSLGRRVVRAVTGDTDGAPPFVRSNLLRLGGRTSPTALANLRSVLSYLELGAWLASVESGEPIASVPTSFDVFEEALRRVRGDRPLYLEFGVFRGVRCAGGRSI
jgi:hypothetical protein